MFSLVLLALKFKAAYASLGELAAEAVSDPPLIV
jgi:hypothetical protein